MLAGHQQRPAHRGNQMRLASQDLRRTQHAHVADAVRPRLHFDSGETGEVLLRPSHHHGARLQQRQVHPLADLEIFAIARLNAGKFQAVRRRIEAGVQQGAVRLACTRENVGRTLQQQHASSVQRKTARHGATDHPAAHNGHIDHLRVSGHQEAFQPVAGLTTGELRAAPDP